MRIRKATAVAVFIAAANALASAQQPSTAQSSGESVFRSVSELVLVPVIVRDKNQGFVSGLGKHDFTILEDGVPQAIAHVEEVQASGKPVRRAAKNGVFTNVLTGEAGARNLVIFAFDSINTPYLDQTTGRKMLLKTMAERLGADQVGSLVLMTPTGLRVIQEFTADKQTVMAALRRLNGRIPFSASLESSGMQTQQDLLEQGAAADVQAEQMLAFLEYAQSQIELLQREAAARATMQCFQQIAQMVAGVPGRKSLIWATGGFPYDLNNPQEFGVRGMFQLYEQTFKLLSDSQVAVYPVDVRGLVNDLGGMAASNPSTFGRGGMRTPQRTTRMALHFATLGTFREVADRTGGRAFYNRNDLDAAFEAAVNDGSRYYLLGYYSKPPERKQKPDARWRKIEVKTRKGLETRARAGYFSSPTGSDDAQDGLSTAAASLIEFTAVPFAVAWTGTQAAKDSPRLPDNKKRIGFKLEIVRGGVALESAADKSRARFDVFAVGRDREGRPADELAQHVDIELKPDKVREFLSQTVTYTNQLELGPGEYRVKFIVRDSVSGRIGTVTAPLTVN